MVYKQLRIHSKEFVEQFFRNPQAAGPETENNIRAVLAMKITAAGYGKLIMFHGNKNSRSDILQLTLYPFCDISKTTKRKTQS